MVDPSSEKELKKGEWRTAIVVAVIGLVTTVLSTVLPWLLSTSGEIAKANQAAGIVESGNTVAATSWPKQKK